MVRTPAAKEPSIEIAKGVTVRAPNPDWHRPFTVVREETFDCPGDPNGPRRYFLCRFDEPRKKDAIGDRWFEFLWFGVVHVGTFTEAWPVLRRQDEPPVPETMTEARLVADGDRVMERNRCCECRRFVRFRRQHRVLGPECVQVTYTCPLCGASDTDVID